MPFQAQFMQGDPLMIDYTPLAGDVVAGEVVDLGNMTGIAHRDIANGTLGALAVGLGVYSVTGLTTIDIGVKVYWAGSIDKVTTVAAGNMPFGKTAANCTVANGTVDVIHCPYF